MEFSRDTQISNLLEVVEERAQELAGEPIFSFLNRAGEVEFELTYGALFERARAIAAALQRQHLARQPLVLLYPHGPEFISAFFGCTLAGALPMPLTKSRGSDWTNIIRIIKSSDAKAILAPASKREQIMTALGAGAELQFVGTDAIDSAAAADWKRPDISEDDIAFVQYTSGSTSRPKGVAITHKNILANSRVIQRNFRSGHTDIGIGWLPFFHDMGLIGHIIKPLYARIHNYFISPLTFAARPVRWLQTISKFKGTISGGPNFAYQLCCDQVSDDELEALDLSSWRVAYSGAEKINVQTIDLFLKKFGAAGFSEKSFYPCYGMAESTLFVCGRYGAQSRGGGKFGEQYMCVGTPDEDVDVAIVDIETGERCADGAVGEIQVKSESVASGYYRSPEQTSLSFNARVGDYAGYLKTGDLGFVAEGSLYYVGRLKNLVKIRGSNYYAEDLEEKVTQSVARFGISRVAAFSVEDAGAEALVLLLEATSTLHEYQNTATVVKETHTTVCDTFGVVPKTVIAVGKGELPLTTSGKLQRNLCRERFLSGQFSSSTEASVT